MKRSLLGMVLFVLAAIWAAGCGGGGGGGGNNGGNNGGTTVSSVTLTPSGPTTLLIGQTVQLTPAAKNASGAAVAVPASNFSFTSSSAPNASVSSTGLVTAVSSSVPSQVVTITVKESSSGKTGSLPITISTGQGGVSAHTVIFTSDRDGIVPSVGQPTTTNIYKEDLDAGVVTQLTHNDGNGSSINASPSPDGTKIVFESNRSGNFEIYMMNADGSGVVPVTANGATNEMPRFSPDSTKIIFASSKDKTGTGATRDNNGRDLYTVPIPTAGAVPTATRLTTTGDGVFNVDPQYSPDSTKIAFAVIPAGGATEDIFVMNADGTGAQQRTNNTAVTRWPAFSPDGTKIIFITNAVVGPSHSTIDIMNSDGTGQRVLLSNGNLLLEPVFFPDTTIVYVSNSQLRLINADGSSADATALGVHLQTSHTATSIESNPHVRFSP